MSVEMFFIVASLIFGLTVIVGANVWALREPPQTELQRSVSRAIEEILDRDNTEWEHPPNGTPLSGQES
jgi:hypothetical protein